MRSTREWISKDEIKEAIEELEKNRQWLEDKVVEQSSRDPSLEPVITLEDIESRV